MPSNNIPHLHHQPWSLPINNTPPQRDLSPFDDFTISHSSPTQLNSSLSNHIYNQPLPSILNTLSSPPTDFYSSFTLTPPAFLPPNIPSRISKPPPKQSPADDPQTSLLAEHRRRRRRESHNAVERRRRDNINEKIQELASLVPQHLLLPDISSPSTLTKDGRPNKGTVLSKSVDYIRTLQNIIDSQNTREADLQDQVQDLQRQLGIPLSDFTHTSAELLLAEIINPEPTIDQVVLTGPNHNIPESYPHREDNTHNEDNTQDKDNTQDYLDSEGKNQHDYTDYQQTEDQFLS